MYCFIDRFTCTSDVDVLIKYQIKYTLNINWNREQDKSPLGQKPPDKKLPNNDEK
jgi:hypothetical protein